MIADIGQAENRAMGREAMVYAGIAWAAGMALLTAALLALRAFRRHPGENKEG